MGRMDTKKFFIVVEDNRKEKNRRNEELIENISNMFKNKNLSLKKINEVE